MPSLKPKTKKPKSKKPRLPLTLTPRVQTPPGRADSLMRTDKHEEAIQVLRPYLDENPEDADTWFQLAVAEDVLGRTETARTSLTACMALEALPEEVLWDWMEYLWDCGESELAVAYARRAVEAEPDEPWRTLALAQTLFYNEQVDEGVELARRVLAYEPPPEHLAAWARRLLFGAEILEELHERPDDAKPFFDRCDDLLPPDDEDVLVRPDDEEEAEEGDIPEPEDVTALSCEERLDRAHRNRVEMVDEMEASGLFPVEEIRLMLDLNVALADFGGWGLMPGVAGSEEEWLAAIAAAKGRAQAAPRAEYAAFLVNPKRWSEARDQAQRALVLDPTLSRAFEALAHLSAYFGEDRDAERCLKESVRRDPGNLGARYGLASIYFALRDYRRLAEAIASVPAQNEAPGETGDA